MVQIIDDPYTGNIFGRIGKGLGQGLSEQLPKEIERRRLSSGLKQLEKEGGNLDPLQYFSRAVTLPGITPQMVESLGQLARQRMQAQALKDFGSSESSGSAFPQNMLSPGSDSGNENVAPSITTRPPIEATLRPFIPRTPEEKMKAAAENYERNPGFFKHDANAALDYEEQRDQTEINRSAALQQQRQNEQNVQSTIQKSLAGQNQLLKAAVPSQVYSRVEDKAINAVKSIQDGGEGLTEQQAIKKYGDLLDEASRDYSSVRSLGNFGMRTKGAGETKRVLNGLQKQFSKRGEQEEFAKELIGQNGLSPAVAFRLAYPVSDVPGLNKYINSLPSLIPTGKKPLVSLKERQKKTSEILPKLVDLMGKKGGPLAVAEELADRGYDPDVFLNYLIENRDNLLTPSQARQLNEARNFLPTLNDLYLLPLLE